MYHIVVHVSQRSAYTWYGILANVQQND